MLPQDLVHLLLRDPMPFRDDMVVISFLFVFIILIVLVMRAVIGAALGFLFGLIAGVATSGDVQLAVVAVGSTLLGAMVSPLVTIALVLLYFDLRVRKEGLDLDQLARQAAPGTAPA